MQRNPSATWCRKLLGALAGALLIGTAMAQLAGAYVATLPNGVLTLALAVSGDAATGTLTGLGLDVRLEGEVSAEATSAAGAAFAPDGSVGAFQADLAADGTLTLTLFDVDAVGRPITDGAITFTFTRRTEAAPTRGDAPARRTPAGASSAAPPAAAPQAAAPQAAAPAPTNPQDLDLAQVAARIHAHASTLLTIADEWIVLAIDAGLAAGAQSGTGFATFGTLTERAGGFAYAASPRDALQVVLADGRTYAIAFDAPPQGDVGDDGGSDFIDAPHALTVRIRSNAAAGGYDVALSSQPAGEAEQDVAFSGTFTDDVATWSVNAQVRRFQSVVFDGVANVTATARGTIALAAPALALDASSALTQRYRLVNVVENVDRTLDTRFTWRGAAYALAGRTFVALREARPVDTDQWVIDGALTGPGGALGRFALASEAGGFRVVVDLGSAQVPLYFFAY